MRTHRPLVHPLTAILTITTEVLVLSPPCLGTDDDTARAASYRLRCVADAHMAGLQVDEEGLCPPEAYLTPAAPTYVEGQAIVKLKDNAYLPIIQADPLIRSTVPVFKHISRLAAGSTPPAGAPSSAKALSKAETILASAAKRGLDRVHLLHLQPTVSVKSILAKYQNDADVEYIQPNYVYYPDLAPNDPRYSEQYAHQLTQAEGAWDMETGTTDVAIAVIGTGVDIDHPDLAANIWTNPGEIPDNDQDDDGNGYVDDVNGWNFVDDNNDPRPGSSHETRVSGVVAAVGDNGEGVCGVAWHAAIMPLRVTYSSAGVAPAIEYAHENGAHIINMSFGNYDKNRYGDGIVKQEIDAAYEENVLLVATAGNDREDTKRYPAALHNVMAVGATDQNDERAQWGTGYTGSNYGPWVDLAAPGSDILSTDYPDGGYATGDGTSYAAPYVSGLGALLLSHDPALTNVEVRAILEGTTDPVPTDVDYIDIGTGRVNAEAALSSSGAAYPLGEIVVPENKDRLAEDATYVSLVLFAHGAWYEAAYSAYGRDTWTVIAEGIPAEDAEEDGLIHLSWDNPGLGTFMLRLIVTQGAYTHTDTKMVAIEGGYQEHWPTPVLGDRRYLMSCPICMDIDEDGRNEIIQSSYGDGGSGGYTYIWNEDGTDVAGWPRWLAGDPSCSTSAVGDVDGDGDYEVVTTTYNGGYVYVWHWQNGELLSGDWPRTYNKHIRSGPVLADLDGDGDSEIIVAVAGYDETYGIHALQHDGTTIWTYPMDNVQAPMAAADLDDDGDIEIVVSGWQETCVLDHSGGLVQYWVGGGHKPVVIADLDRDSELEAICANGAGGTMRAVHLDGSVLWEADAGPGVSSYGASSAGDLDGDGYMEVFVAARVGTEVNNKVYAFDRAGNPLTALGFPKDTLGGLLQTAPTVGDIDGDAEKDVLVGSRTGLLFAWDGDGAAMDGFPRLISGGFAATATLADLDQDGDIEVMVGTDDYLFHVWDLPGTYDPETIDWAMYRHDPQCSGLALRAPKLSPLEIPSVIGVGNTLQLELGASNPDNLTLSFYVRQMPTGASFDDETRIFTWTPTPDQVDQVFDFYLFVTDGIRQDHRPVSITVMCTEAPVPTASGWGMIVMALLTLTAGTVVYSRPRLPDFASRQ